LAKTQQIMDDTAGAPRAGEVGALLRVTRERSNQTLRDVADALRIRMAHLEAIEAGEYERLPGATYAVGFVRAYADHLGLDSNEIVRRFKAESAIVPTRNDLAMPIPVSDGGLPSGAAIVLGLLVIGGIYGAWYLVSNSDRPVAEMVQEVPDRFMALLDSQMDDAAEEPAEAPDEIEPGQQVNLDAPPATSEPAPAPAATVAPETVAPPADEAAGPPEAPEAPAVEEAAPVVEEVTPVVEEETAPPPPPPTPVAEAPAAPAPEEAAAPEPTPAPQPEPEVAEAPPAPPAAPEPEPEPEQAAPQPPAPPAAPEPEAAAPVPAAPSLASVPTDGRVYGEENVNARIILRAREDSWVQVRDNEGLLLTRLLRAGDSYRVPSRDGLRLMTGNAGGLLIELDGTLLPPLGGTGEVRRNIALEPAALRGGGATPN